MEGERMRCPNRPKPAAPLTETTFYHKKVTRVSRWERFGPEQGFHNLTQEGHPVKNAGVWRKDQYSMGRVPTLCATHLDSRA
jgi:hypothetical protein